MTHNGEFTGILFKPISFVNQGSTLGHLLLHHFIVGCAVVLLC